MPQPPNRFVKARLTNASRCQRYREISIDQAQFLNVLLDFSLLLPLPPLSTSTSSTGSCKYGSTRRPRGPYFTLMRSSCYWKSQRKPSTSPRHLPSTTTTHSSPPSRLGIFPYLSSGLPCLVPPYLSSCSPWGIGLEKLSGQRFESQECKSRVKKKARRGAKDSNHLLAGMS